MAVLAKRNGHSVQRQRRGRGLSPFGDVGSPLFDAFPEFSGLGRLLDNMMRLPLAAVAAEEAFVPAIDVYEKDGNYVVEAALPGFRKEDISIDVGSNQVTITGEFEESQEDRQKRYSEMRRAAFARTVVLPQEIDTDRAQASFEDGILRIVLPPTSPIANRRLEIQGSSETQSGTSGASGSTAGSAGGGSQTAGSPAAAGSGTASEQAQR